MIFVFGSNKRGIHGAGAAKYAHKHHGAVMGVGEGPTGNSYALPTKGYEIEVISLEEIQESVNNFLEYAKANPDKNFKVTQVGCGLGGYTPEQIAPLFRGVWLPNLYFDTAWHNFLGANTKYWGTG